LQAPLISPINQGVEREFSSLQSPLDSVPSPLEAKDKREDGASEAAFMLSEATGHQHNQEDADGESRAGRQSADETTNSSRSKINWIGARISGFCFWYLQTLRIPNSIAKLQSNW
jgi:hypothetical protein